LDIGRKKEDPKVCNKTIESTLRELSIVMNSKGQQPLILRLLPFIVINYSKIVITCWKIASDVGLLKTRVL
jgi:hypothetical protein